MADKDKSVVVIGGGVSGLLSVKSCLEEGINVRCYELTECIGGLWKYRDNSPEHVSVLQKSTIINSSKEMMSFSDFPPPKELPNFMHNRILWKYLEKYASHFNLLPHMKFNHKVVSCAKSKEGEKWIIKGVNTQTGECWSDTADNVMVCNGHLAKPKIPDIPGLKDFKGKVIHTRDYKHTAGFEDKNVLVVGIGNSGGDAAVELSTVTNKLYLSVRTGTWVFKRVGLNGIPSDYQINRMLSYLLNTFPSLASSMLEKDLNRAFDHELFGLKPKHRILEQHPMVNDDLPNRIISGRIAIKGGIDHFTEDGVCFFNDSTEYKIDVIVLGTGYLIAFPFLDDSITGINHSLNEVKLFKYVIPPKDSSIAIIGLIQPYGPFTPLGEAQTRWYVQYLAGKVKLPSYEEMLAEIEATAQKMKKRFKKSRRYTLEIDVLDYMDDLYQQIGAKPNLKSLLLEDPQLFWKLLFGPLLPYQYRLQGPHKWGAARNAIMTADERMKEPLMRKDKTKEMSKGFNILYLIFVLVGIFFAYFKFSSN